MPPPHVLVHCDADNVGVVVVEGVGPGIELQGVVLENRRAFSVRAEAAIPLGHKVALVDLAQGDAAVAYGEEIGRMIAAAGRGGAVHVHNLRTQRW